MKRAKAPKRQYRVIRTGFLQINEGLCGIAEFGCGSDIEIGVGSGIVVSGRAFVGTIQIISNSTRV